MKIEMKLKFKTVEELDSWINYACTRCAMCNKENGKNDPCKCCRIEKTYRTWNEFFGRKEDD